MNRRTAIATLALLPSLYSAQAQPKPPGPAPQKAPTRTPRTMATRVPSPTPEPLGILPMELRAYLKRIADDLESIVGAMGEVRHLALEAITAPVKVTDKWSDGFVAQALTARNTCTSILAIDPPESTALSHVYLLRFAIITREAVDGYVESVTGLDSDKLLAASKSQDAAEEELRKAVGLAKQGK